MNAMRMWMLIACWGVFAAPAAAHAQSPYFLGYYGFGNQYLAGAPYYAPIYANTQPAPYFATNPPVYYSSQIIRRPYGDSPYAWPPIPRYHGSPAAVAQAEAPAPLMVINPFVDGASEWSPPSTAGSVKAAQQQNTEALPPPAEQPAVPAPPMAPPPTGG